MRSFVFTGLLVLLLAGCSGQSYVGRGLSDLGAYFNSYYNAQNAFEKGLKAYEDDTRAIDRTVFMRVFPTPEQLRNQDTFESTIEKSADVLREHPQSHLVDDAVLLIGKSYFYLQNYGSARQKFREVVELATPLEGEARFWLARTLTAQAAYEEALRSVQESLMEEGLSASWAGRLHFVLGGLHVQRGQWEEAAAELQTGLEKVEERGLRARAYFLLGQVHEQVGRYGEATSAYERAADQRPYFELAYAAQTSAIRVRGLHGDATGALRQLAAMQRDDKYYDKRAELAYLEARLLQEQGQIETALQTYQELLYASDVALQNVRGRAHYALGLLHRDAKNDFMRAAAHFDTAATSLPSLDAENVRYAPAAIDDVVQLSEAYGSFSDAMTHLQRIDSLLALGALDDKAFQEAVMELRRKRGRELKAKQEAAARREVNNQFSGGVGMRNDDGSVQDRTPASTESGFLYHKDPMQVQASLREFYDQWGKRPLAPNWRRRAALQSAGGQGGAADAARADELLAQVTEERLPEVDISAVPRDSLRRAEMRADRALARYALGSVLFMQLGLPDSAATWYRRVIQEDAGQPIVPRAYYALAQVEQARGNSAESRRLSRMIMDRFPSSSLAARIRMRTSGRARSVASSDSVAHAHAAYRRASELWEQQQYDAALDSMMSLAMRYDQTPVAPQALLAAGTLYLEWTEEDTLALRRQLPVALSDTSLAWFGLEPVDSSAGLATPAPLTRDSLAPSADAAAGATGSVARAADSAAVAADSVAVAPRPAAAVADSSAVAPDAAYAAPAGRRPQLTIETVLSTLVTRYPSSPHASRAEDMLGAIEEMLTPVVPPGDTSASPSLPADSAAVGPQAAGTTATVTTPTNPSVIKNTTVDTTRRAPRVAPGSRSPGDSTSSGPLPVPETVSTPAAPPVDTSSTRRRLRAPETKSTPATVPSDSTVERVR